MYVDVCGRAVEMVALAHLFHLRKQPAEGSRLLESKVEECWVGRKLRGQLLELTCSIPGGLSMF